MRQESAVRVVVADDHHLVRQGIRALLDRAENVEVVGEAADGRQAVDMVARLTPDVLTMDIAMPRLDGGQAIGHVRALDVATEVVILSMYTDETLVWKALRDGAKGYLPKSASHEELLLAIRAAHRGEIYVSPAVARPVWDSLLAAPGEGEPNSVADRLTPREREVLQLVAEGYTNKGIARALQISVKTVEKHRASLMDKLDAHSLAELICKAIRHGLVLLSP
jgi:DNA-binding NarL/FixJ family response regulator